MIHRDKEVPGQKVLVVEQVVGSVEQTDRPGRGPDPRGRRPPRLEEEEGLDDLLDVREVLLAEAGVFVLGVEQIDGQAFAVDPVDQACATAFCSATMITK